MKRPSYRHAIRWIGINDEPTADHSETVNLISVALVASIFDVAKLKVTADVIRFREWYWPTF